MKKKTISGHYDSVFSLDHNNRTFTPKNVDPERTKWNYNCVAAGQEAYLDFEDPRYVQEFWKRYRELNDLYWSNRVLADALEYERYRETMRYLWKCRQMLNFEPENEVEAFFYLLCLPLIIYGHALLTVKEIHTEWKHFEFKCERNLQLQDFKDRKLTAREILREFDQESTNIYLDLMDALVRDAARSAENYEDASRQISFNPKKPERFATLEEIYGKIYEPSFRKFQEKQRPCRRYKGTYLEYIREGQQKMIAKKKQSRNTRNRKTSEAIELVFGIGDIDNTGYVAAFADAKKSEAILKDYSDYLMRQKNVCFVTTKELEDPEWKPPFKHGLIVLNLTVHCDEATPGIHLTFIPYSRECKRGPEVQASLGRAMTGMGYPSTWKDVLDENGEKIPKRDKENGIICNKDGTIRYQQEPEHQGIIDWIEDQKKWIQNEMERRHGWEREYKGSHPRGNLSTPDYQVARAKERQREMEERISKMYSSFVAGINVQINRLNATVDEVWRNTDEWEKVLKYLNTCPQEEYEEFVERAKNHLDNLPLKEMEKIKVELDAQINNAAKKRKGQQPTVTSKYLEYNI